MFLGLRTAIYPVPDLDSAKSWYEQVVGPQALWGVARADAAIERLLALGATLLEPVTDVGGGIKVAAVRDPFGNRLGIIENPHFKTSDVR